MGDSATLKNQMYPLLLGITGVVNSCFYIKKKKVVFPITQIPLVFLVFSQNGDDLFPDTSFLFIYAAQFM